MPRIEVEDQFRSERTQNSNRRKARKSYGEVWLDAPDDFFISGAASEGSLSSREAVVALANGTASFLYVTIRKRSMWTRGGQLQATLFYTGDTGSTATIDFVYQASERSATDDISSAHSHSVTDSVAGPAAAKTLLSHTFSDNLDVGGGGQYLSFVFGRNASDSYAGVAYITGVELKYLSRN